MLATTLRSYNARNGRVVLDHNTSKITRAVTRTSTTVRTETRVTSTSFLRRIWGTYLYYLEEKPLLTKAGFAATVFFCSDSVTQYMVCEDRDWFTWNSSRALSGASFGIIAAGWLHYWWGFLELMVSRRLPPTTHKLANTLTKVALDQSIGAPLYIFTYYVVTNFVKERISGESKLSCYDHLNRTATRATDMLWSTMLQHWKVWVPVHSCNFYFVPFHHRVMVQNTVLTFWSGYLSFLNNKTVVMSPDAEIEATAARTLTSRQTVRKESSKPLPPSLLNQSAKNTNIEHR